MTRIAFLLALIGAQLGSAASVDGTVTNATTGKPQPGVIVSLVQPGEGGMQALGNAVTDAQGKFRIDKSGQGMQLLQAIYQAVPYSKMLAAGAPTTGVPIEVFDATKDVATAKISQHIVFLQPASDALSVNEVYFLKNDTRKTLNNPAAGALRFYVPVAKAQADSVRVTINAPGGMPIQRPAEATEGAGVFRVNYPVKPGETEFNVAYSMPAGTQFASRNVQPGVDTRLVVPRGVTLTGDGLTSLGADPSGKATLYTVAAREYSVTIGGSAETATAGADAAEEDTGQPRIEQTNPRLYGELPLVLGLAGTILLVGLVILYRSGPSKGKAAK